VLGRSSDPKTPRAPLPWRELQWIIVGVVLVTGLVLGWIGLDRYYAGGHHGPSPSIADSVYFDLKLFSFGGAPSPPLPWELGVARFLLPIAFGFAAFAALFGIFRDRARLIRLPFLRNHVIVAGLGAKGLALVHALRADGTRVVAIEIDPTSPALAGTRRAGVPVVVGDATDPGILKLVGTSRASHVVATASDAVNAEVALRAQQIRRNPRRPPLECLVHILDSGLARLLRRDAFIADRHGLVHVDFFNVPDLGARRLLVDFVEPGTRLVVVGLEPTGERVVVNATGRDDGLPAGSPVLVVGDDATERLATLRARHPWLGESVVAVDCPLDAPSLVADVVFPPGGGAGGGAGPATVVVGLEDSSDTLEVALGLRDAARAHGSTIIAALSRPGSLAGVIDRSGTDGPDRTTLRAVSLPDLTCTSELVTGGTVEQIARAAHESYVRERQAEGTRDPDDPSLAPWDELPETLKVSNRDQATHIVLKLRRIGCGIVVADDPRPDDFTFSTAEVEDLGHEEHVRWVAERVAQGWRSGPERDPIARTTPYLVDWEALPEDVRELDRETVRNIPALMARAGFAIERLPTAATTPG
jgi:hypothetical protein